MCVEDLQKWIWRVSVESCALLYHCLIYKKFTNWYLTLRREVNLKSLNYLFFNEI